LTRRRPQFATTLARYFLLWHFSPGDKIENCSAQLLAVCWIVRVELKVHRPRDGVSGLESESKDCETRCLGQSEPMKYWEIIADRLHAEGWSYGIAEHLTKHGLLFCVDAHRDGKRFIVKADDLLTAFLRWRKTR
jgi:hypothetical protein